jgi:hypothetical protein
MKILLTFCLYLLCLCGVNAQVAHHHKSWNVYQVKDLNHHYILQEFRMNDYYNQYVIDEETFVINPALPVTPANAIVEAHYQWRFQDPSTGIVSCQTDVTFLCNAGVISVVVTPNATPMSPWYPSHDIAGSYVVNGNVSTWKYSRNAYTLINYTPYLGWLRGTWSNQPLPGQGVPGPAVGYYSLSAYQTREIAPLYCGLRNPYNPGSTICDSASGYSNIALGTSPLFDGGLGVPPWESTTESTVYVPPFPTVHYVTETYIPTAFWQQFNH